MYTFHVFKSLMVGGGPIYVSALVIWPLGGSACKVVFTLFFGFPCYCFFLPCSVFLFCLFLARARFLPPPWYVYECFYLCRSRARGRNELLFRSSSAQSLIPRLKPFVCFHLLCFFGTIYVLHVIYANTDCCL